MINPPTSADARFVVGSTPALSKYLEDVYWEKAQKFRQVEEKLLSNPIIFTPEKREIA